MLGYDIETLPLYHEMSARDLVQRRATSPDGDTIWEISPLVRAALNGHLAVLDGIRYPYICNVFIVG